MSTVLFDAPGPRARRRYRIIAVVFGVLVLAALWWAYDKLHTEGVLTADVANDVLQKQPQGRCDRDRSGPDLRPGVRCRPVE
jgi:hypothetical protein